MAGAGALRDRWTFQQRGEDANGDRRGPWGTGFTVAAEVTWLRGSEQVMQDRLTGRQPIILTIRASSDTRQIGAGWRAIDARNTSMAANIQAVSPSRRAGFLDVLAVVGGAQG